MVHLWFLFAVCFLNFSFTYTLNVEYAHKDAIRKHAMWSNIIVDFLMGFVLGAAFLLKNTDTICIWSIAIVHHMIEALLRSGCVWLICRWIDISVFYKIYKIRVAYLFYTITPE